MKMIKKIFGEDWFCRMFHNGIEVSDTHWKCISCNRLVKKTKSEQLKKTKHL